MNAAEMTASLDFALSDDQLALRGVADRILDDHASHEQLTAIDVRKGFGAVKDQAKACGPKHGVAAGTKVSVKVSIAGSTGKIESAQAMGEHAGSAVGQCVAEALSQATFPQFRKAVMGLTYPVVL